MKSVLRPPPQLNRDAGKVGPATRQFGRLLSLLRAADFVLPEERKKDFPSFISLVRSFVPGFVASIPTPTCVPPVPPSRSFSRSPLHFFLLFVSLRNFLAQNSDR